MTTPSGSPPASPTSIDPPAFADIETDPRAIERVILELAYVVGEAGG